MIHRIENDDVERRRKSRDLLLFGIEPPPESRRSIAYALEQRAKLVPDKVAIIDEYGSKTYRETFDGSNCLARNLAGLGAEAGDCVATFLDNHIDAAMICLGLGAGLFVEVPVNPAYKGYMLQYVVEHSGAAIAFVEDHMCETLAAVAPELTKLKTVIVRGGDGRALEGRFEIVRLEDMFRGDATPLEPAAAWDPLAIMYTSGTTGPSKGAIIPHGAAFNAALAHPPTTPDDVVMVAQPIFHIGGRWHGMYNALVQGATAFLPNRFSASRFWDDVREYGCTVALLVGAMGDFLWKQPPRDDDRDHPLRLAQLCPLIKEAEAFEERFGIKLITSYGMTEAGVVTYTRPGDVLDPKGSGWLRPGYEARIVDDNDIELPDGTPGEMILRSTDPWTLMNGYHDMPEATIAAWRNQWYHTGDVMARADDGQFCFIDRKKDAMRRRGENVSSFEVEAQLLRHPDILQAAVVAVPSEHSEDDIMAVIVARDGKEIDFGEMLQFLVDNLPYFMVPRYIQLRTELPMTPTLRVKKAELREQGIIAGTWDCEANGLRVTRTGIVPIDPAGSASTAASSV